MSEPDVLQGAFEIARVEYPNLDIPAYRARLDQFARDARAHVDAGGLRAVDQVNDFVFETLGFQGNDGDYDDPRNSYLNDVIDRRTGLPITLATVYCEIATRLGVPAFGVGFPGHFLVRCPAPPGDVIVDCFQGRTLSRRECQELLESHFPDKPRLTDDMLAIAAPRAILSRMLGNLRRVHLLRGEFPKVLRWIEMDMVLRPGVPENLRDRGLVYARMEEVGKAIVDLERYAAAAPKSGDAGAIAGQIEILRKLLTRLN